MKNFTLNSKLKVSIILGLMLFLHPIFAQDVGFVHMTHSTNIVGNYSYIDSPLLNNNPSAKFVISQRYNGISNNRATGIWYSASAQKWAVYNENLSSMPAGIGFNIFIPDDSSINVHVTDATNTIGHVSYLNGFDNGAYVFHSNYYNPNNIYNDKVYGTWQTGPDRWIMAENVTDIPMGAAFMIMGGSDVSSTLAFFISETSNITPNGLRLDHPMLNNNPNAVFVYSHRYAYPDTSNSVYLSSITDATYADGYWHIYAYAVSFPSNVTFDVIIPNTILDVEDQAIEYDKIKIYPNPVKDVTNFQSKAKIEEIQVVNLSGQVVLTSKQTGNSVQVNIANLPSGIYLAKIKTAQGWSSQKLIKQ